MKSEYSAPTQASLQRDLKLFKCYIDSQAGGALGLPYAISVWHRDIRREIHSGNGKESLKVGTVSACIKIFESKLDSYPCSHQELFTII